MPEFDSLQSLLGYLLPLILWGALTGILNLAFTYKSQIEAWVEANPRLAAWAKLSRSVGFDPWAFRAWLLLLIKKRLPDAQKANSAIAKNEQRKADAKRLGPPSGGSGAGPSVPFDVEGEKTPPSLPGARLVGLALCALLLVGCARMADPCSEVSLATVQAGCEVRVEAECKAGDKTCPVYVECSKAIKTWRNCP
jgi:hypothetical protein